MSNLTRARRLDEVVFRDASGKIHTGVALVFHSDRMTVGVTNPDNPTVEVMQRRVRADGTCYRRRVSVANNSVWDVPYDAIMRTQVSGYIPRS